MSDDFTVDTMNRRSVEYLTPANATVNNYLGDSEHRWTSETALLSAGKYRKIKFDRSIDHDLFNASRDHESPVGVYAMT